MELLFSFITEIFFFILDGHAVQRLQSSSMLPLQSLVNSGSHGGGRGGGGGGNEGRVRGVVGLGSSFSFTDEGVLAALNSAINRAWAIVSTIFCNKKKMERNPVRDVVTNRYGIIIFSV